MANGMDSTFTAALLAQVNGGTAVTLTTPLRCLFMTGTARSSDTGSDTEVTTGSGYVAGAGSLGANPPTVLAFAASSAGAPSTQNSNAAATVTNMPATTWVGCTISDSKATPRSTSADGNTTNASLAISSATAAFSSPADVGAIVTGTNIPTNTVIASVGSSTTATLSQPASGTATTTVLTINRLNSPNKTFWANLASSKTVNLGDTVTVPSGSWQTTLG